MSRTFVQEGGIPSEVTNLQLDLVGAEHSPTVEPSNPDPRISSVPLRDSRGLPLDDPVSQNPPNWPTIRGTPAYRPYEENISFEDRPLGQNGGEFGFLIFMLSGVQIVSAGNGLWRSTVGRFTDEIFKYNIGGQW